MTDLEIRYEKGRMVIHLEEFLSCRSEAKVRKLLKIIQRSYTSEVADQIQQHIKERYSGIDGLAKISANQVARFTEEVNNIEHDIEVWKSQRARFKKSEKGWEHYNENLKKSRKILKDAKSSLCSVKCEFNNHMRDKVFFEKLLSAIFS